LRGNNSYSGGTRFFSGNLKFYQANSLGTGTVTLGGKINTSHALSLLNQSALTVTNAFELVGITDTTINGSAPTFSGVRGTTPSNLAAQAEFNTTGGNLALSGPLSGTGGLLKSGANTLTLSGSNTYSGPTKVSAGTLACASAASLAGGTLDITTSAVLALNYSGTRAVAGLTFNGGALQAAGTYGSTTSTATNKSARSNRRLDAGGARRAADLHRHGDGQRADRQCDVLCHGKTVRHDRLYYRCHGAWHECLEWLLSSQPHHQQPVDRAV
jgi:autotransporter-associated beta strand protein